MLLIHKELLLLFKIIPEASFVGLFKTKHKKLFWFILHDSFIMTSKERYHILGIISVVYHEERNHLTRAPLGYFYNAPHWGGYFEPPLISETTGPIVKIQGAFESPGKTV